MNPTIDDRWFRATTLRERARGLAPRLEAAAPSDAAALEKVLDWRRRARLPDEEMLRRRLAQDGLTPDSFARLLEASPAELRACLDQPRWIRKLQSTWRWQAEEATPLPDDLEDWLRREPGVIAGPIVRRYFDRLLTVLDDVTAPADVVDLDRVGHDLLWRLLARSRDVCAKTFVLELNIARLEGALTGTTPEERYRSFVQALDDPRRSWELLSLFPVLGRTLVSVADDWLAASVELIQRVVADHAAVAAALSPEQPLGRLVEIRSELGDIHDGGRSVSRLRFESGVQVIYKPRSLEVERHFCDLLGWLNDRGLSTPMHLPRVLPRQEYGWMEFVVAADCADRAQVARFYRRQGVNLALLYVLEGRDFHYENIVAMGEHPVLIDVEALFSPEERGAGEQRPEERFLARSVIKTLLLPTPLYAPDGDQEGVEIGGLSSPKARAIPGADGYVLDASYTDEMHLVRTQPVSGDGKNQPRIAGEVMDVRAFRDDLLAGFEEGYRLLLAHRAELGAPGGPILRFSGARIRIIKRDTAFYGLLIQDSVHPDALGDALTRDRLFDRTLTEGAAGGELMAFDEGIRGALERCEVPMFTTTTSGLELRCGRAVTVPGHFRTSGLDCVRRNIAELSEDDLVRQVWVIRASLAPSRPEGRHAAGGEQHVPVSRGPASRARLEAAVIRAVERLEATAFRGGDSVTWVGVLCNPHRQEFGPLRLDLSSGLAGVALFLGWAGEILGHAGATALARDTLRTVRSRLARGRAGGERVGGFGGLGGVIYALCSLSALWRDPELLGDARLIAGWIDELLPEDRFHDLFLGSAGAAVGTLALHELTGDPEVLAVARRCGEQLVTHACAAGPGVGWVLPGRIEPLTGYSHGAAGIAHALSRLQAATGDARFGALCRGALAFERASYAPDEGNWRDMGRASAEASSACNVAWCYGAPGIGLARLAMLRAADDPEMEGELRTAVATTVAHGFGYNHSLCHGDLGNLELLLSARQHRPALVPVDTLSSSIATVLDDLEERGFVSGLTDPIDNPGFTTGVAGTGYQLLRLLAPDRVPSALVLALPG
jgi:type 2 lantibiotic biosynthesis protein LanM